MTREDYLNHQFATLRREIEGQQIRIFWIIIIGLLGMPALGYFLLSETTHMWLTLPFFLLALVLLYLAEQNHMIRAGRYIREFIEPQTGFTPTWESWLSQHAELRLVDKHFSSCFVVLFFLYYFLAVVYAMDRLVQDAIANPSPVGWYWVFGAGGVYLVTTLWGVATLVRHWRSLIAPKAGQ